MKIKFGMLAILTVGMLLTTGCYLRPDLGPPGTWETQRSRAVLHDPFPKNDLGPPIVGGRPLGYDMPRSEATDVQDTPYAPLSQRGGAFGNRNGF